MPKSLKDKHRDRPWFDRDGDLWFWDINQNEWFVVYYSGVALERRYTAQEGDPDWAYGPYRLAVPKSG